MTLTNFNRSSYYLFILISLATTSCTEQSTTHLAVDRQITSEPVITATVPTAPQESVVLQPTMAQEPTMAETFAQLKALADIQYPESSHSEKTVIRQTKSESAPAKTEKSHKESVITNTASAIASTAVTRYKNSVWGRMFSMYALPAVDHPRVEQELQNFLKHPKSLAALQRRAEPYLYLILDELEAKKLPGELALLPMIESAFKVDAQSQAEAVGLWQFTPATAETFGLKQNWWYDGRRDVFASTEAATSYLKKLHKRFDGNWLLALASYNVGAGNVQKAIRKNTELSLETNFWDLDLPEETKAYVPKLLAIAKIFAHADEYKLPLQRIPNKPFFKAVNVNAQLDLSTAAELAGMPVDEFFSLNTAFNHAITAPEGSYRLLVKAKNAATFKRKLAKLPKTDYVKWGEHIIRVGEDLNSIAKLHDVSVDAIVEINQLKDQKLAVGSILRLPPAKVLKLAAKV